MKKMFHKNQVTRTLLMFSALTFCLIPGFLRVASAQTISQCDLDHIYKDTVWYDPCSGSGIYGQCSTSVDISLSGNDRMAQAYNFFVQMGLTPQQAAGIVGNLMWESGLDPENIQNPKGRSQNPADAGSYGWGIAQWTPGSKILDIASAANITGPIYELSTQLQILWAQLTGNAGSQSETQAGNDVKSAKTVEEAVRAFQGDLKIGGHYIGFERPQDEGATLDDRIKLANSVLAATGGGSSGTDIPVPAGPNGTCSSSVGPGQDTQYVDGFTVYSQYDAQWKDLPYSSSNIGDSGCGPTAMAMIITALTGRQITPDITAAYAASQGLYVPGEGSRWSIAPVLADHWGLKAEAIGADAARITAALEAGKLVITSGEGPLPFTSGGHFIVIRGVTADGHWLIGDPGHSGTSDQPWDPQQLLASMNDGSVYAISK